jgi:predicted nuclease with TOPRIM domain
VNIKISNWAIFAILIGIGLLIFALIRGCNNIKNNSATLQRADSLNKEQSKVILESKNNADSIVKEYRDSLEFERGQYALLEAQKERRENEMGELSKQNKELLDRYKLAKYEDTTSATVPGAFIKDCGSCFVQLEKTNNINSQYRNDINKLEDNWNKQSGLYQNRFKKLEEERVGLYNRIASITAQQKEQLDKLKPRGRLYLSWGVLWQGWPSAAGAGLMYQTPRNMIFGVMGYYGAGKTTIGTTINFPLSLKFK